MSTRFSPQLDPSAVLGVEPTASLEEIRDAYRTKAKRYHPDAGGDEWAFRILAKAYELLSVARVVRATHHEEFRASQGPGTAQPPPPPPRDAGPVPPRSQGDKTETVRQGVQEPAFHPTQVVEVETLSVCYEADHVWLLTEHGTNHRMLSCSINLSWPDSEITEPPESIPHAELILKSLNDLFDSVTLKSRPVSAKSSVVEGRFTGWLSYPNNDRASAAFEELRQQLHSAGLVVNHWTRDLLVPRQAR